MRVFGPAINDDTRQALIDLAEQVYRSVPAKREVRAADFAMEDNPERIVVREVELKWDDERLRVGKTLDAARPPFEWIYEISSDVGDTEYIKHYLVRAGDIVLAQRKVLTVIDDVEADVMRADLEAALASTRG